MIVFITLFQGFYNFIFGICSTLIGMLLVAAVWLEMTHSEFVRFVQIYLDNAKDGSFNYGFSGQITKWDLDANAQFASFDNATVVNRPQLTLVYEPYHKIFAASAGLGM